MKSYFLFFSEDTNVAYLTKRFGSKCLLGFNGRSCGMSLVATNGSSLVGRGDWDFRRVWTDEFESEFLGIWTENKIQNRRDQ
mgnify:CR=1 FL=1